LRSSTTSRPAWQPRPVCARSDTLKRGRQRFTNCGTTPSTLEDFFKRLDGYRHARVDRTAQTVQKARFLYDGGSSSALCGSLAAPCQLLNVQSTSNSIARGGEDDWEDHRGDPHSEPSFGSVGWQTSGVSSQDKMLGQAEIFHFILDLSASSFRQCRWLRPFSQFELPNVQHA
jgi:hypothetical protein